MHYVVSVVTVTAQCGVILPLFIPLASLHHAVSQISVEEQGRSLVIKIDREAVMKIAVNGDLFTLKKGLHELNLTVGGIPFKQDGLISKVRGA